MTIRSSRDSVADVESIGAAGDDSSSEQLADRAVDSERVYGGKWPRGLIGMPSQFFCSELLLRSSRAPARSNGGIAVRPPLTRRSSSRTSAGRRNSSPTKKPARSQLGLLLSCEGVFQRVHQRRRLQSIGRAAFWNLCCVSALRCATKCRTAAKP